MKIAFTCLYLPSGSKIGVGYQVHYLANELSRRGHDLTVYSPCPKPPDALYDVIVVPPGKRFRTFGFAWDLRKINFDRFDILNAHGDDWFLWGIKRPRHIHTYMGSCLAEMLNIRGVKEKLRMGLLAICEQQSVLLPDETVAISENTRKYIKGIMHVIPCGVDRSSFRPAENSDKNHTPTILFVGTMHGRKRGRWLVDVFEKEIRPRLPNAELWCVCDRPKDFVPSDGVRFFGRVEEAVLTELFRKAWIFCLPSSYEGFGVPYIEAMSSGLPVAASPNVGALEILRNGRDGVIADDNTMGEQIVNLLADGTRRDHYRIAGLERSRDFEWSKVCEMYEAVYVGSK